jgi:AraC family transcriptional regulator, transcriptional activator of pobA
MGNIENLEIGHVKHGFENKFIINISDRFTDKTLETDFPHRHKFFMICLIVNGKGTHVIDFERIEIKTNRLFFIRPEQVHYWDLFPGSKLAVVQFTQDFLTTLFSYDNIPALNPPGESFFDLKPDVALTFLEILKKIQLEFDQSRPNANKIIQANIFIMLSEIERIMNTESFQRTKSNKYIILEKFRSLLNRKYKEITTVRGYANLLNITPNYLNIVVKETTGFTSNELIQNRVILEAKRLLINNKADVSQIASELGFKDSSYFARYFKRSSGVSPSQFRDNIYKMYQHHNE